MRYLDKELSNFATQKFVLLSGPRQVGKTTIAQDWLSKQNGLYLNWDIPEDKQSILKQNFLEKKNFSALVLDELHKYSRWKSWLKGLYDRQERTFQVVVTGSARLNVFQKGGDSLLGRYEYLRLHPLSIGELTHGTIPPPPEDWLSLSTADHNQDQHWAQLQQMSGFPEPFFKNDPLYYNRWANRRRDLLIREDIRELTEIRNITLIEHLAVMLPDRVASQLSVNALREELGTAHDTVTSWLEVLERLYYCFRISPYSKKISRSLKKEQKLYLWDWAQVDDPGARFENMIASHLLKSIHAWNDLGHATFELFYLRDKDKNEVDFLVTKNKKPIVMIEAKLSDQSPNKSFFKFDTTLGSLPKIQLVNDSGVDIKKDNLRIVSAAKYLSALT